MTTFLQLHLLTSYPPACLNRDDLNRPKTAVMGGVPRLRISSQSLKRAWRVSDLFREQLSGQTGIRSKEMGRRIRDALLSGRPLIDSLQSRGPAPTTDGKVSEKDANEWAWMIAAKFVDKKGKTKDDDSEAAAKSNVSKKTLKSEQVVFYARAEIEALDKLVRELRTGGRAPVADQLKDIKAKEAARTADLALFGRMLASSPDFNVEAACQVAHAITVHRAPVEDDFFTAVDDLNTREEDTGLAHMGEQGFGAGLFYLYVCLDCDLLKENLQGDSDLAGKTIRALTETAATVAPTGKQNSFASRAHAFYVLAEQGSRQPRSLSLAFMKPVREGNMLDDAVEALTIVRANLDKVYYGEKSLDSREINGVKGKGDFRELVDFAADCYGSAS